MYSLQRFKVNCENIEMRQVEWYIDAWLKGREVAPSDDAILEGLLVPLCSLSYILGLFPSPSLKLTGLCNN